MAVNTRAFQYYMDNFFKFPREIKNDLIYCQRSMKSHIKVHQMVIEVFQQEEDADATQMQRILDEIESEIYEINAEQHFLLLRLRRIIDEFHKILKRNAIPMDENALKNLISREVITLVNDPCIEILPSTVLFRNSEQKLIEKYFEVQKEKTIYEIEDSDEETDQTNETQWKRTKNGYNIFNEALQTDDDGLQEHYSEENGNSLSQMSLLKPISQRVVGNGIMQSNCEGLEDVSKFLQMNLIEQKNTVNSTALRNTSSCPDDAIKSEDSLEQNTDLPVSKNVKISRLNLRQALNKARTENMVAKAAANLLARSNTLSTGAVREATDTVVNAHIPKKYDTRPRAPKTNASNAISKERIASEIHSSSEDSNPEYNPGPTQPLYGFVEEEEHRTLPEHYGQEMFLRFFQLYTPEILVQMQQRRSKRKRRNVQNNERADFHYGRIEYGSYPPPEKKRKEFLLSPQVKRVLQTKRPKRNTAEKNEDTIPSRSTSSSPDEKHYCNECLKSDGCFEQCADCKGYYHQLCHKESDEKANTSRKTSVLPSKLKKLCPPCKRSQTVTLNKEEQQYKNLHFTAQALQRKLVQEKDRRFNLQKESKMYKLQMRNLFNIVNTIKSDQENDSSG